MYLTNLQVLTSITIYISHLYNLFFFLIILSIFNTHMGRGENVFLKKFTVVYIQKGLTPGYTAQALNTY